MHFVILPKDIKKHHGKNIAKQFNFNTVLLMYSNPGGQSQRTSFPLTGAKDRSRGAGLLITGHYATGYLEFLVYCPQNVCFYFSCL